MQVIGKIGFRYATDFDRLPEEVIRSYQELLEKTGCLTGNVGDCVGRAAAMAAEVRSLSAGMKVIGPALTVRVSPGDNLMIHKALTLARPGDVMVIDGGGVTSVALLGALIVKTAIKIGLKGMIVDGSVRDAAEIRELRFPLFARGINPNGPDKEGPGEISFPISCGGRIVNPGDIIVGDDDGVVVVPREAGARVLKEVQGVIDREAKRVREIEAGMITRPGLDETLKGKGLV